VTQLGRLLSLKECFEVVGIEEGILGCLGLLGCEDIRPNHLPLQDQLGMLRRKMGWTAFLRARFCVG
jgi:fumarate reductase iron-sulfur subunit